MSRNFTEWYQFLSLTLLSGGLDSTVLAAWSKPKLGLFVDYGQPARLPARLAASGVAKTLGVPLEVITVSGIALGSMDDPTGTPGPRVVAARNTILASLATNRAAALGIGVVLIGATGGDRDAYPDCRKEFFDDLSTLSVSTTGVEIHAPLVEMSRAQVVELGEEIGAPVEISWSCYTPNADGEPCGGCDSCEVRR